MVFHLFYQELYKSFELKENTTKTFYLHWINRTMRLIVILADIHLFFQ